ncbi:uncharacterized protein [Argopecten irradians]|uniref:uncharacterized protein n=1 Tax=Argopecten irradians TaxID=31199 RepID=UPI0037112851
MECIWWLLLHCIASLVSGAPDSAGTEFILGFTSMSNITQEVVLYFTTVKNSNIHVQVTAPKYSADISDTSFNITSRVTKMITISGNIRMSESIKEGKGVHISASDEISVFGLDSEGDSGDYFLAQPTDVLGMHYYVMANNSLFTQSQVVLAGVNDKTAVSITLSSAVGGNVMVQGMNYGRNDTISLGLNRYDTFYFTSEWDLSGTEITANKPLAMFSGTKNEFHITNDMAGHVIEQATPTKSWGKVFIVAPIPAINSVNILKFVANDVRTSVSMACQGTGPMDFVLTEPGDKASRELPSTDYCVVKADKPILVAQFCKSITDNTETSLIIIPPKQQHDSDYTFTTPGVIASTFEHTLVVIVDANQASGFRLDGVDPFSLSIQSSQTQSEYTVRRIQITEGTHTLRHSSPTVTFACYLYSTAPNKLYVTAAGTRSAPINEACAMTPSVTGDGVDNDCDGRIDEELCVATPTRNLIGDDDGDGQTNEDCAKLAAVDGGWSDWSNYTACSITCDNEPWSANNGTQSRTRTCTNPVPANDGMRCTGQAIQIRHCNSSVACPETFNYFVGFMETGNDAWHELIITNPGIKVANLTVIAQFGIIRNASISSLDTTTVSLTTNFTVRGSALSFSAIRIKSDSPVQVYVYNSNPSTVLIKSGFLAREYAVLGTLYYALTASAQVGQAEIFPQILIVALFPSTAVSVEINVQNGNQNGVFIEGIFFNNNDEFVITMGEFQTLQIQSETGDFTGMAIRSSKPISVFSGNKYFEGSTDHHLVDQLAPVVNWGNTFVAIAPSNANYKCKIVTSQPATVLYTCSSYPSNERTLTLDVEGSHVEIDVGSDTCKFRSVIPIMMAMITSRPDGTPSLVQLQPLTEISGKLIFYVPSTANETEVLISSNSNLFSHIKVDCKSVNENILIVNEITSGRKFVRSGIHIIYANETSIGLPIPFTGLIHGLSGASTFSYPLLLDSLRVDGGADYLDICESGQGTSQSASSASQSSSATQTATTDNIIRSSVGFTETTLQTSMMTQSIYSTSFITESISPTPVLSSTQSITLSQTRSFVAQQTASSTIGVTLSSSASLTESTMSPNVTSAPTCECMNCSTYTPTNYTTEELLEIIQELRAELLIHRNATNSYLRTKISAKDDRPSAKAMGFMGCIILIAAGIGVIFIDMVSLIRMFKELKRNICKVIQKT